MTSKKKVSVKMWIVGDENNALVTRRLFRVRADARQWHREFHVSPMEKYGHRIIRVEVREL